MLSRNSNFPAKLFLFILGFSPQADVKMGSGASLLMLIINIILEPLPFANSVHGRNIDSAQTDCLFLKIISARGSERF